MKKLFKILFIFIFIFTNLIINSFSIDSNLKKELMIKSALLYNFLRFVKFNSEPLELNIYVDGKDNIIVFLSNTLKNKKLHEKPINIIKFTNLNNLKKNSFLFIIDKPKKLIEKSSITTITQVNNDNLKGIINFIIKNNKIRFEVNNKKALMLDIKISSKLLKLAILIE